MKRYTKYTSLRDLIIDRYDRETLREMAKEIGVQVGRNKIDTVDNILDSPRWAIIIDLVISPRSTE